MTEVEKTVTPAEVAQAVLDGIEAERDAFNMSQWAHRGDGRGVTYLTPEQSPTACGTTLCAAGMVAHFLGWTITSGGHAYKGDKQSHVRDVAEKALDLSAFEGSRLWYCSEEEAIDQLRQIAEGHSPEN